ncbi:hypothetical protein MLD38_000466 [Melastoma candidum]|uniref:Uncharacterized protein n=1 Tax=Melastoma candidum TaxID=119954 RepID=A0ACB9SAM3_9MYRT|nr:hypothetical protein MLD38_000466 [Melastoma candidum]
MTPPVEALSPASTAVATATATAGTRKRRRSLRSNTTPPLQTPINNSNPNPGWTPLPLFPGDLSLPLTFPTGQTFLWKQTSASPLRFTGPVGPHLISLSTTPNPNELSYLLHSSHSLPHLAASSLLSFLNYSIDLSRIWEEFSAVDPRFSRLLVYLRGARVLRQDPVECLFQFLCSSNNNIARITKMVDYLASLGRKLGSVGGYDFYEFPSLECLAEVSEEELRAAGFGYRAKYIVKAVEVLQSKPGGGAAWLESLRELDLQDVIDALCTLPGVGGKVAACVALFSLDQHHAVPVDTHVWQIGTRDLLPELAGAKMSPKLCSRVADAFESVLLHMSDDCIQGWVMPFFIHELM